MKQRPPQLGAWLLERLRPHGDSDILLGDFEEEFTYLRDRYGAGYARRWYGRQVLWSIPGFSSQLVYWSLTMLQNYLKIAFRNLIRHGHYTAINLIGLAVVLACCIVAYLNYDFSTSFDAFHANADQIYRVNSTKVVNDREQTWGITPMPLGPALKNDFAFIEDAVRLSETDAVMQVGDKVFNETMTFADEGFFEMFTFSLKDGTLDVLYDPNKVVLTEDMALKYFGDTNPIDQAITMKFGEEVRSFSVGGVVEKIPLNSSIQFDILTTYDNLSIVVEDMEDWGRWGLVTFIQVSDLAPLATLPDQLTRYLELQNTARPDWEIERFYVESLPEMYLTSQATRAYVLQEGMQASQVVAPAVLALLLLLMACFNFMNTSMAFADRRLKEIGIRKVVGGRRRQLIGQFMGESMLLCTLAFGLALLLAEIFVPAYSSLWPNQDLEIVYRENVPLLAFLGMLLFATGLLAGAYPAFYISSFNPTHILKGRQQLGGTSTFTRTLLTLQLSIAVLVIIASVVFTNNARYQETFDLGYDKDMVMVVPLGEPERFTPYRDAVAQNPMFLSVAGSRNHIGFSYFDRVLESEPTAQREAVHSEVDLYFVGEAYLETVGMHLIAGRGFDVNQETDFTDGVLVNQTLVREMGWTEPVGQIVTMDSTRYQVVGVFKDFYDAGLWNPIDPAVFRLTTPEPHRYLTVRVRAEDLTAANTFLEQAWQRLVPEEPYDGIYQDEVLAETILVNTSIRIVFYYIAIISILIAAAGLFALVSLNIARRTKEIGIRKVLGASILSISHLINREFIVILLIASVIASVGGYFMIDLLLDSIWAYHVGVGFMPFLLSTLLIFVVALLTVGGRIYKIATGNPVDALRYE